MFGVSFEITSTAILGQKAFRNGVAKQSCKDIVMRYQLPDN